MFDASFSEKGKKMYKKATKKVELKAAKNGIFYLPKGKYRAKIGNAENEFEIK
jgi:hypothetical protein